MTHGLRSFFKYVVAPVLIIMLFGYALSRITEPTDPTIAGPETVRAVIGLHGGGGGFGPGGFGSGSDWPSGEFRSIETTDAGCRYRIDGVEKDGVPCLSTGYNYSNPAEVAAYLNAILDAEHIEAAIVHGFSYGGGMVLSFAAHNETLNGRLVGLIADDPAFYGSPGYNGSVPLSIYGARAVSGAYAVDEIQSCDCMAQLASIYGVPIQENPTVIGHGPYVPAPEEESLVWFNVGDGDGVSPPGKAATIPGKAKVIDGVSVFPNNNFRYAYVRDLPVRSDSAARIAGTLAASGRFGDIGYPLDSVHPDFFTDVGMPYVVVAGDQPLVPITSWKYGYSQAESTPYNGAYSYPIPLDAPMETNSDRHIIVIQPETNRLFELWDPTREGDGYSVGLITVWDLGSNAALPDGQTSADAAGLPILSGLYEVTDVADGEVNHSCRMTVDYPGGAYEWPANHVAEPSADDGTHMLMGTWVRLKADADVSDLGPQASVIARAMQNYGCQIIDVGPNWKISGVPSPGWDNTDLLTLHNLKGSDFEVIDTSSIRATTTDRNRWLEVIGGAVPEPAPPVDTLPRIVVDTPTPGSTVGHEFLVAGSSNTFEATHMVQVVSGSSIVAQQFVTATCGTGCRGTWSITMELPAAVTGPVTLRAFELSSEDGVTELGLVEIPLIVDQGIVTTTPPSVVPTTPTVTTVPSTPGATLPPSTTTVVPDDDCLRRRADGTCDVFLK